MTVKATGIYANAIRKLINDIAAVTDGVVVVLDVSDPYNVVVASRRQS